MALTLLYLSTTPPRANPDLSGLFIRMNTIASFPATPVPRALRAPAPKAVKFQGSASDSRAGECALLELRELLRGCAPGEKLKFVWTPGYTDAEWAILAKHVDFQLERPNDRVGTISILAPQPVCGKAGREEVTDVWQHQCGGPGTACPTGESAHPQADGLPGKDAAPCRGCAYFTSRS